MTKTKPRGKKVLVGWINMNKYNGGISFYFNTVKRYVDCRPVKVTITIQQDAKK